MTRGQEGSKAEQVSRTWERYAQSRRKARAWAGDNPGNLAIREELVRTALPPVLEAAGTAGPVLDVGCGTGWWLARLAEAGVEASRLHGVELLPDRAEAAREAVPGADIRLADARELPHDDASFGAVTLLTVASSLRSRRDVAMALGEAARVLRPRGALLVYEPRVPTPNPATRLIGKRDFSAAGLDDPETTSLTVVPPLVRRLGRLTPRAYGLLARAPALRTHRLLVWRRPG